MNRSGAILLGLGIFALTLCGCKEGETIPNSPPDSFISIEKINLHGEDRLNSSVSLSWYGTDIDGFAEKFEFSINQGPWFETFARDSVFRFALDPGVDTTDVDFRLRAIDNEGAVDQTPAQLRIPLRNSPPVVEFDKDIVPKDTAFTAFTFRWLFDDPDGASTVTNAYLKINNGDWTEIDRSQPLVTIVASDPSQSGSQTANIYYGSETKPGIENVPGLNNDGFNTFQLKVLDLAGAESKPDTIENLYIKSAKSNILMIGGQPEQINKEYNKILSDIGIQFDYIDLARDGGKNQPYFWDPTFRLLAAQYDIIFFNADQSIFVNAATGETGILLEFAAPVLQDYTNNGGKSFITTSFPSGYDPSAISGPYPLDSLSTTSGQAVLQSDSSIYSDDPVYQSLSVKPQNLILGCDPFVPTVDATPLFRGQFSTFGAWEGPDVVGAYREQNGVKQQIFFSMELYLFKADPTKLRDLFTKLFNDLNQ